MNDLDILRSAIATLISKHGIEKTKELVASVFSEYQRPEQVKIECSQCRPPLEVTDSYRGSLYLARCKNCNCWRIVYRGTARTARQAVSYGVKRVTIRCYDADGSERAIEFKYHYPEINRFELKSRDKFLIIVKESDDVVFSNLTVWEFRGQYTQFRCGARLN